MEATGVLGIDVGGVIIDRVNDGTDTSFMGDNYLQTTAVPGVFAAIARLVGERFGAKNTYVVSKCGQNVQDKTLRWLAHHRFYELTGVDPTHVRFCRKRHEKGPICAELGITDFVDDRLEVLSHLTTVPRRYLFRASTKEVQQFNAHLPGVIQVTEWSEIVARLLPETRVG